MRTSAIPITLSIAGVLFAQTHDTPAPDLRYADNTIQSLRQISKELAETVRRFNSHLDEAASKFDRGYRPDNGLRLQGADVDLTSPAEIVPTAVRKSIAFRMLASRSDRYEPDAVADLDHIQELIGEARKRASDSTAILRTLLVVSSRDISPQRDAEVKARHDQLIKARGAAEQAADEAYASLPVEATDSLERNGGPAWNLTVSDSPRSPPRTKPNPALPTTGSKPTLPVRIEHRKRITLVNESYCRVALTDSGTEDEKARHLFYEEEWLQRGDVVIRKRWRVAVDTTTGQHILVKRYPAIELAGFLVNVYEPIERDHLWYSEPPDGAKEPSREELEHALADVRESRGALEDAAAAFNAVIRNLLARQDQLRAAENQYPLDAELPEALRASLFAIRADLGRVSAVVESEKRVWEAVEMARHSVGTLESVAAWANRTPGEPGSNGLTTVEWDKALQLSDREIDLLYATERDAVRMLPPDMSRPEAEFPALEKNVIVRIRRIPGQNQKDGTVRCLQEVWRMEMAMPRAQKVQRTAVLISVDPKTGNQVLTRSKTLFYPAGAGDILEEIFDENAADDILLTDRS